MATDDLVLLALFGAGGFYLYQKRKKGSAVATTDFQLPQIPGLLPANGQLPGPLPQQPDLAQTIAGSAGDALSEVTGIPGFGQAASAIAGLFGQGRKQADRLVQTYQNPLLAQATVIVNSWHQALDTGKATVAVKEQVKALLKHLVAQFDAIASEPQFNRAGPGGIQTVNGVLNDVWLPNIELEWQRQGVH